MKKFLALMLAIVLMCGVLAACGGSANANSPIVGTWKLTKGVASGITVDPSQLGMEMSFRFDANGKAAMVYNGDTTEGLSWRLEGDVVKLGVSGTDLYDFAYDGSTLTVEESGVKMIFEKN